MPEFRGPKNLHIGADTKKDAKTGVETLVPAWAESAYDDKAHEYVIKLSDSDADKFRAFDDEHKYGFREVESAKDESPEDTSPDAE